MFTRIADLTMSGIRPDPTGLLPVEVAIKSVLLEPQMSYLLMQIPSGRANKGPANKTGTKTPEADNVKKRVHEELMAAQKKAKALKQAGRVSNPQGGKGGKNGKGDRFPGPNKDINLPKALIGKQALTADGKRICFSYNLDGCSLAAPGEACTKGMHVCMEPHCQKNHSINAHGR